MATINHPGKYLESQLKLYLPNFIELDKPDYLGLDPSRRFVTITDDLPIALQSISYFTRTDFGGTAIFDKNSEIPMVDFAISEDKVVGKLMFATGARWNIFDINTYRTAQQLGTLVTTQNPVSTKMEIMKDFLDETENNMILYGAEERGCYGLFNQPDVTVEDETGLGTGNFYSLTPAEAYDQFILWIQQFIRSAKLSTASQIEIMIPERLKALLARPYETGVMGTVWNSLTNTSQAYYVNRIVSATELEGENLLAVGIKANDEDDRIIFKATTANNNIKMHRYPRQMLEPYQRSSIDYEVISFSGLSSAYIIDKKLMMYVDIANGN